MTVTTHWQISAPGDLEESVILELRDLSGPDERIIDIGVFPSSMAAVKFIGLPALWCRIGDHRRTPTPYPARFPLYRATMITQGAY